MCLAGLAAEYAVRVEVGVVDEAHCADWEWRDEWKASQAPKESPSRSGVGMGS